MPFAFSDGSPSVELGIALLIIAVAFVATSPSPLTGAARKGEGMDSTESDARTCPKTQKPPHRIFRRRRQDAEPAVKGVRWWNVEMSAQRCRSGALQEPSSYVGLGRRDGF